MNMDETINLIHDELWTDVEHEKTFPAKRPMLAHYTTIETLEGIISNDELWFSNPLYMNDYEELRFGMLESERLFRENQDIIDACCSDERYVIVREHFEKLFSDFNQKHAFDTYVFCFSEHDPDNPDGLLSMWRGYGEDGNGAAVVFNMQKINYRKYTPLILSNVIYATRDERISWIRNKLSKFSELLQKYDIPNDQLWRAVSELFERLKMFSIFTKHQGFAEEKEWRIVYLRERDVDDVFSNMLNYAVGQKGVELKFKLKIAPIEGFTDDDLSLEKIVHEIILGPAISTSLAYRSMCRMLEVKNKQGLIDRVRVSTTPYRSTRR